MPVILREAPHAHEAVQRTGWLVAMTRAEFAVAQRQVAIAAEIRIEDQHVARAVHRLHGEVALLGLRREHVLLEVFPVPRFFPQRAVEDLRGAHFEITVVLIDAAHVLLDLLPERPAFRMPEHEPGRDVLLME